MSFTFSFGTPATPSDVVSTEEVKVEDASATGATGAALEEDFVDDSRLKLPSGACVCLSRSLSSVSLLFRGRFSAVSGVTSTCVAVWRGGGCGFGAGGCCGAHLNSTKPSKHSRKKGRGTACACVCARCAAATVCCCVPASRRRSRGRNTPNPTSVTCGTNGSACPPPHCTFRNITLPVAVCAQLCSCVSLFFVFVFCVLGVLFARGFFVVLNCCVWCGVCVVHRYDGVHRRRVARRRAVCARTGREGSVQRPLQAVPVRARARGCTL